MVSVLIVGATRGLGASLANAYASDPSNVVFGTTRSAAGPTDDKISKKVNWIPHIDLMSPDVGGNLVNQLGTFGVGNRMVDGGVKGFDVVVCSTLLSIS